MRTFYSEGQIYFELFNEHFRHWNWLAAHYVKFDDEYYLLFDFLCDLDDKEPDPSLLRLRKLDKSRIIPFDNFPKGAPCPLDDFYEFVNASYDGDVATLPEILIEGYFELAPV